MLPPGVERYTRPHNRALIEDFAAILPTATWAAARDIHVALIESRDADTIAAIGLIDRYFLLAYLLRRADLYERFDAKGRDWLYWRCREVEAAPDGYLDLWAREHYKSTLITFVGGIQEVLRDPELTCGIFSHTRPVAKAFLRQIKSEFEQNKQIVEIYPDVLWSEPHKQSPKWSEDDGIVLRRDSNPKEATFEAWGLVDGQPIGRHFGLRLYDDVVTDRSVTTPEMVEKTTFARQLSDNLGTHGGREWNIGTRYSFADTYQDMLDRRVVIPRIYPATHNGLPDGDPVLLSPEAWADKKRKQPRTIAAQMLQNPAAGEDGMFSVGDLRAYEVRPRTLNVYIMVDPSKGRSATSDRTAIAVIGVDTASNRYLLDGLRSRLNLRQRWLALKALHRHWRSRPGVHLVAVGYEQYGMQTDLEYIEERQQIEDYHFGIEELAWPRDGKGSKEDRVGRLVPDWISGAFMVPNVIHRSDMGGSCTWRWENGSIVYQPVRGLTARQREVRDDEPHRIAKPILRKDEAGKVYDLTAALIDEAMYFPFGQYKDLIDAVSRLYDMQPTPPMIVSDTAINPGVYVDT